MESEEAIGLDLGGTKLATGVVDGEGRLLWSDEVPSSGYSQEGVIDLLSEAILRARKERPGAAIAGIGIPARVEQRTGRAVGTVNLDLEDVAVRDLVTERCGLPIALDNDANLAMLAEAIHGAARGTRNALMLTIGTGIGGGIWIDGDLYRGATGSAGELGHIVVDPDGPPCQGNCPGRGCVEAFASGTAIGERGREAAASEPDSALGRMVAEGREVSAVEVGEAAAGGDRVAGEVLERAGRMLGVALTSLANAFEPEVIVVGGGGIALGDLLLDPARRELAGRALDPMSKTPVVAAELGPAAGMIGAATLARSDLGSRD